MNNKVTLEIRTNNFIYKCFLDNSYYNLAQKKGYAVTVVRGVVEQGNQAMMGTESAIICDDCWGENMGNKGLQLKDPLGIAVADPGVLNNIKKPGN